MDSSSSSSSTAALKNFELANSIIPINDSSLDSIFRYDQAEQRKALESAPWRTDPHFFKTVRISAVALIKMVMHARSGGIYEVMGLMQGKVDLAHKTLYVMDAFALPVEGTETRVNAQNEAYEYMVEYLESSKSVGRLENVIGWYHSHPGYGCWLSGIDVNTQMTNQQYQDPFVAVVIDPNRTISAGKVDIGAFRTFPPNYQPPNHTSSSSEYQSIPLNKIEDFGVHTNSYYPLTIEHFKSSLDSKLLDLLWNKYWVNTLSQSPLIVNRACTVGQINDLALKLSKASSHSDVQKHSITVNPLSDPSAVSSSVIESSTKDPSSSSSSTPQHLEPLLNEIQKRESQTYLSQISTDAAKIAHEAQHGLLVQLLKDRLFSHRSESSFPDFM